MFRPTVGERAPEITLRHTDGTSWRTADHRGRALVLIFHRHIH